MPDPKPYRFYLGRGQTLEERGVTLPDVEGKDLNKSPKGYIAAKELSDAVNVALMLEQPLLVTGEPGTGKTQLAWSIADELFQSEPLVFHTKTTSTARDLFYSYDALLHFRDANLKDEKNSLDINNYITYEALGKAIMQTRSENPIRSVILIDEIDKAPRDFPNDILHEIDELSFTVKETGKTYEVEEKYKPVIVLTSNSEKNLPDAFLRRCIFYDIPFPQAADLKKIVMNRLKLSAQFQTDMLDEAIKHFEAIRELTLKKKPATAELIAWIKVLERMQIDLKNLRPEEADALALTYSVLAKNSDDLEIIKETFHK